MKKNILLLEKYIRNPKKGLPQNFFLFLSRVTPLINVDLLIKNADKAMYSAKKSGKNQYAIFNSN